MIGDRNESRTDTKCRPDSHLFHNKKRLSQRYDGRLPQVQKAQTHSAQDGHFMFFRQGCRRIHMDLISGSQAIGIFWDFFSLSS